MNNKLKRFLLDLMFPKTCFGCRKEETYLCQDCESVLDILYTHQQFKDPYLNDLYFAISYEVPLIKKLIIRLKNQPFIKELSQDLSRLIINHFQLIEFDNHKFNDFIAIPVPSCIKKLKWRGFSHTEELAKYLSSYFKIPLINNALIKTKQADFHCINKHKIKDKSILLINDVYKADSTTTKCAEILKLSGAKKIIGIVVAINAQNKI